MTTKYFCRKFEACAEGRRFANQFKTMRECYDALLRGDAGKRSTDWAIWTITRPGVMSDRDLRLFAVKCARRVQHLMKDARSSKALGVALRYANGEATQEELVDARNAACNVVRTAMGTVAWNARAAAWSTVWSTVCDVGFAAWAAERREQLKILAEFGNPFN